MTESPGCSLRTFGGQVSPASDPHWAVGIYGASLARHLESRLTFAVVRSDCFSRHSLAQSNRSSTGSSAAVLLEFRTRLDLVRHTHDF